jgi:hypothetical protein
MSGEVKVDDAFIRAVLEKAGTHYPIDIMRATLAVAAERGLVVPDGAPRALARKEDTGLIDVEGVFVWRDDAEENLFAGETVVRVALVEIKEDGK